MKEGSEQAINQAKYDDAQAEAKQAKLEANTNSHYMANRWTIMEGKP